MTKNLITGIGGFVAGHLAEFILEKNEEVIGTYRWTEDLSRIQKIKEKIKMVPADLLDFVSLFRVLADNKPDYIFHLAAQSYVGDSYSNPIITVETNTIGTVNLLEAIRLVRDYVDSKYDPVVHICSSSEYYGKVNENEIPITEQNEVRPGNQYAIGKVGADAAAYFYYHYYGIKTIRTRMFTHTGYGRTMQSAECNFARQIARIEKGLQEPTIKHGNLNSVRTWANVKDAVKAYWLLVRKGKPGEVYNIGGKVNKTIEDMLNYMISLSPMKDKINKEIENANFLETIKELSKKYPKTMIHLTMVENLPGQTNEIHIKDMKILKEMGYEEVRGFPFRNNKYRHFQCSSCAPFPGTKMHADLGLDKKETMQDYIGYDGSK